MPSGWRGKNMSRFSNISLTAERNLVDKFSNLGEGFTDRIFILGHANSDTVALNDPYLVLDLEDTLAAFNTDTEWTYDASSPLIRAFLNCYYSGGRDIYLVRVADMDSYEVYERRDTDWYQDYYDALVPTYTMLSDLEKPMIILPIGADYEAYRFWYEVPEGPDFFYQLTQHCLNAPSICYGLLPCRLKWPNYLYDEGIGPLDPRIVSDWREITSDGRTIDPRICVGVVYGEGYFDRREIAASFSFDLCATVAGSISRMEMHLSPLCEPLHDIMALNSELTTSELDGLAEARLMVVGRTWEGERGKRGGFMLLNDNSTALEESDYAHFSVLRLAQKVVEEIRPIAESYIGTPRLPEFRRDFTRCMEGLKANSIFRDYKADIYTLPGQLHDVRVDINLYPYLCHRWISVNVELGPSKGFEVL
jgi:hypothetical protein